MAEQQLSAAETWLARASEQGRARLRLYIGAAAGVGKSYQMLEDAHQLRREGTDVVIGFIEPHGREDTRNLIGDLEQVPLRAIEYRGVTLREMDLEAIKARHPQVALVDELAHTNAPGSTHQQRFDDVIDLLTAGINVITAVNIQHIESLNDVVARTTGVRVRETVPDWVVDEASEVVLVDLTPSGLDGQTAEDRLDAVGITVNRNAIPFDPRPPMNPSGLRIGTPALTTRGLVEEDMTEIASVIATALSDDFEAQKDALGERTRTLMERYPLYPQLSPASV